MVKRKLQVLTDNSSWEAPKKVRKPRKPMTEKQRVAAAKRLEKAREARAAKNPEYGLSSIHTSLRDLPNDHQLHPKKVKLWIKTQKEILKAERANLRNKIKGSVSKVAEHKSYIRNMKKYLRDGDWVDDFYGEYMDKKISRRCIAQGYYWYGPNKGELKFDVGVWYPLLGCVYTQEMYNEDEEMKNAKSTKR